MSVSATILLIDDDAAIRTIVGLALKRYGHLVLVAGSGEEALRLVRNHAEIQVIILDVILPGIAGQELAAQLKTTLPDAVILFCSGHAASALARYGVDPDGANFLQKPCRAPELQEKIEELMATC
jgi:CheY-like chemotaxis protein